MVKLFCAVVGVAGSAFEVDIDADQTVGDLKEAIKGKKIKEANTLQLFLAKKDGEWLTQKLTENLTEKGATFTDGLTQLDVCAAPLGLVGLSEEDVQYQVTLEHIRAKSTHVNVLVVLSSKMLRIGVDETSADKISSYVEIAERLKDSEEVRSLSDHVAQVIAEGQSPTPFIVLENSSGTGKTQMAFNLQARGECDVFYIVCGTAGDREQTVYTAYAERTSAFQGCVRRDLDALKKVALDKRAPLGAVGQIRGQTTLALYGFILAALRRQDEFCGEARRSDVIAELEKRGTRPFVFFLDEFPRAGRVQTHMSDMGQRELENSLRMMRNVFRSFKLAVVVSSTNGTARNLLTTSSRSRGSEPYLWCVVVPSFPRVVLNGGAAVPALVMKIISHSRPLFAQSAIKYVQDYPYTDGHDLGDYLNAMASALAPRFGWFKKRSSEFTMGQLCLLLCSSYRVVDDKVNIIDGHFARLDERTSFELQLDANGDLRKDGGSWKCRCVLPLPEEDMLLHLTMAGGPSFHPFDKRLHEVMSEIQPPLHYSNTEQRSNDGMRLEALTAAAVVLASHAGGFGGVAFSTFLRELLFELGVREPGMTLELPDDVKNAGAGTLIVPFLSPPNAKWPEWLLTDSSTRFDNLVRARNEDGIDFRTSHLISGECKDYSSAVKLDVMKKNLVRIPAESTIHLVVVNTLQPRYLTAESAWEEFVREQNLQNVCVYRVSKESTLREIEGMSNNSGVAAPSHLATGTATAARRIDKLVLFIELG